MPFDDYVDSFNARARDSFNTSTTNTANLNVGLENVGNTDESVNDSGNVEVSVAGSGNTDSHDLAVDIDDSGNTWTDASVDDHSDNSVTDSNNAWTDESTNGSYNAFTLGVVDDHSINAGVREYNTGFGDLTVGGGTGLGGDGDVFVDNRATVVDGSINQNIDAFAVNQDVFSDTVVASGDGAIAAGDDVDIQQSLDESTTIDAGGDVALNSSSTVDVAIGSYNEETDASSYTDASQDWQIDGSFNDASDSYTAENSFNHEISLTSDTDWDVDANVIWDSDDSAVVEDVDVELPPL